MSRNKELRCNAPRLPAIAQEPKCGMCGAASLCVIALTKKAPCPVRTTESFEVKGNPLSSMHVYGACLALRHLEEWALGRDSAAASVRHVQVDILVWHGSAVSLCDLEPV